jgi:alpha-galactosidase
VIITISTGGFDAMAHDIAIPEDYGIYHTVGDTSGPGGWARALRNIPVFVGLAETIGRYAPGAVVLNYTNPMTTLTKVLCDLYPGPAVGLCHGLFENLAFLKELYGLAGEDELSVRYAGLNHFFWITEIRTRKRDILADLNRRLRNSGVTELRREAYPDPMGFKSFRELATELWALTGVMPYLGDRHTCEFFPAYITSKKNMRRYKLVRTTVKERRDRRREAIARLQRYARKGVPPEMVKPSRETASDIITAHFTGQSFIDVGNLPNIGQVSSLPLGTVVETAVRVDSCGFAPIAFGDLPEPIQGFVEPWTRVFDMTVEACLRNDVGLALQALRLDPTCAHLTGEQVEEMGLRLIRAHRKFIPKLASKT